MRIRSTSPQTLDILNLPPSPSPDSTSPVVDIKREPTPFDELPMSHLISFPMMDSPTNDHMDASNFDGFGLPHQYDYQSSASLLRDAFDPYYRLPNSNPTPISDALNMNLHGGAFKPQLHGHTMQDLSSLSYSAPQQQCIPTSQLFPSSAPPIPVKSSSPVDDRVSLSPQPVASSSRVQPSSQPQKKRPARATISTKDFVPPDVSGLSKREARLVKNRAAAFLSRQRKREEFETMEVRVAHLESENARLLALTQSASRDSRSPSPSRSGSASAESDAELASLRSLLAQSRARQAELEGELTRVRMSGSESGSDIGSPNAGAIQIKRENAGADVVPKRSSASLFGVVLLCALPSLLSMPPSSVPYAASRFSFTPGPGASVSHPSRAAADSLLDWPGMDIDDAHGARRKVNLPLSFINGQAGANSFLQNFANSADLPTFPTSDLETTEAEFEVSFVPSPTDGKIRVRIESPASSSSISPASEPSLTYGGSSPRSSLGSGSPSFAHTSPPTESWDLDFPAPEQQNFMWDSPVSVPGANVDISMTNSQATGSRRRVRIALKTRPTAGAEGGEWEVEVC
ncbi:hypothetical protein M422DRAFT_776573 [Sphaerobolus stellatus SS14]|nr:hypothetical protein M422DRAFT_776573 [Sphaerobolus stellatus SS14]